MAASISIGSDAISAKTKIDCRHQKSKVLELSKIGVWRRPAVGIKVIVVVKTAKFDVQRGPCGDIIRRILSEGSRDRSELIKGQCQYLLHWLGGNVALAAEVTLLDKCEIGSLTATPALQKFSSIDSLGDEDGYHAGDVVLVPAEKQQLFE
jgi:hypothetical protein